MATAALPAPQVTNNADGTKTIVSFRIDDGKKIKVTRKIREHAVEASAVSAAVASRHGWARYGLAVEDARARKGAEYKPDYGEEVILRLSPKSAKPDKQAEEDAPVKKAAVMTGVHCRTCGGEHFTHKCPFKDKLGGIEEPSPGLEGSPGVMTPPLGGVPGGAPGRYQPPSLRGGVIPPPGRGPMDDRDENTLRVSNIPENAQDMALRMLFSKFGRVKRCHVVRDRMTGQGRGFAFVTFETTAQAERARDICDGKPLDHLIMHVEFSKKSNPGGGNRF